jgi:ABC-type branched-subunit amino acid transport system substrate-binding protein
MRVRGVVVLAVVGALLAASCGNSSDKATSDNTPPPTQAGATTTTADLSQHNPINETGVTDKDIRVSVVASITNPLGTNYKAFADGIQAYFDMVNADGGIYGRQLKIAKVRDDNLGNNSAQVQAAVAQDNAFAVFIAALLFTGSKTLAQQNVPTFGWNINQEWIGPTNFFPNAGALCFKCARPGLPSLAKEIKATKVAALAYTAQQSADCVAGIQASFKKYPVAKIVFTDTSLPFGITDLSAQVARMKSLGVQFIAPCMDVNGVFTLAKEMKKQGLNAVMELPNSYDQDFMKANGDYFEGDYVLPGFLAFEVEKQPKEMQDFFEWMEKDNKKVVELSMHGWIAANQFVTGLKLAGPDFTRDKVIQALNGVTDFTADGLLAPIDWTKDHVDPEKNPTSVGELECSNLVVVKNKAFEPVFATADKPWRCFKTADMKLGDDTPTELPPASNYSFAPEDQ